MISLSCLFHTHPLTSQLLCTAWLRASIAKCTRLGCPIHTHQGSCKQLSPLANVNRRWPVCTLLAIYVRSAPVMTLGVPAPPFVQPFDCVAAHQHYSLDESNHIVSNFLALDPADPSEHHVDGLITVVQCAARAIFTKYEGPGSVSTPHRQARGGNLQNISKLIASKSLVDQDTGGHSVCGKNAKPCQ